MFKKQFLLTSLQFQLIENFKEVNIGGYFLQYSNLLQFTTSSRAEKTCYLLGEVFSFETPELSNQEILDALLKTETIEELLIEVSKYYGQYVFIYKDTEHCILFNDACAQSEIYYTTDYTAFGSQVKLLERNTPLIPHDNPEAIGYYNSKEFNKLKLFIDNTTHVKNVKHLYANHYINLKKKSVKRFYPNKKVSAIGVDDAAVKVATMLKGYLKAIALRHKICLPVTAGYDSRVLFLASLGLDCNYFVTRFSSMKADDNDLVISKELVGIYNKGFSIVEDHELKKEDFDSSYEKSLDFPLFLTPDQVEGRVIINGNISEIGRNGFYYLKWITAKNLNIVNFFELNPFITKQYNSWLKHNKKRLERLKYSLLDVFLWEQFMGIVHGKAKSQNKALGVTVMSPYNSRVLLDIMLGVNRSKRDRLDNELYNAIIAYLSDNNEAVMKLPINPSVSKNRYLKIKKWKLHKIYSTLKIKLKSL